jgi:hypothetical protein
MGSAHRALTMSAAFVPLRGFGRRVRIATLAAAIALGSGGCHDNSMAVEFNGVRVTLKSDGIDIQNTTDQRLAYFVINNSALAFTQWTRCTETSVTCLRIDAHSTMFVAFADIVQYQQHDQIAVFTWTVQNGQSVEVADILLSQP